MAPSNFVPTINEASGNYKGKLLGDGFMSAKVGLCGRFLRFLYQGR